MAAATARGMLLTSMKKMITSMATTTTMTVTMIDELV